MDFLGYMAAGGVERLAIIAAALLIVFWGYKLYAGGLSSQRETDGPSSTENFSRSGTGPGILFMGIGCTVLLITLITGGTHLQSAGEAYRSAGSVALDTAPTTQAEPAGTAPLVSADSAPVAVPTETASDASAAEVAPAVPAPAVEAASAPTEVATAAPAEAETEPASETLPPAGASDETDETAASLDFATGRELGGRIVSVKSERATIQWSGDGE